MATENRYYIGIDVGTQSVRAGLVTDQGKVIVTASLPITTWHPFPDVYEQSSEAIWKACTELVRIVTKGLDKKLVRGIGFDATCSLVVIDKNFKPLSVSKTGNSEQNVILWMDHRAVDEAKFITSLSHPVLKFIGGKMSPEMEPPKILWLKKNLPSQWDKIGYLFDLPDYLTWKATGCFSRSLCSLVCKWTYQAGMEGLEGWQDDFWKEIGLGDLVNDGYKKIGAVALTPGEPCGCGLNSISAKEMGLLPFTPCSASIIDAHAGGLGVLSCAEPSGLVSSLENRMALICGTSTCHMKVNKDPIFTPGIWGPYYSAMVPHFWSSEAGQSAAGVLLDHIFKMHPAAAELKQKCGCDKHITDLLHEELHTLSIKKELVSVSRLTEEFHVWPDYHGNRSPIADPGLKGMICGLNLMSDNEALAIQYLATLQSLAYGTKHIINSLEETGHKIDTLLVCGGLAKNQFYIQMHADITGLPVIVPNESESVLLGAALLGATAAKDFSSVTAAMASMCGSGRLIKPNLDDKKYHQKKYNAFLELLECQKAIKLIMES